MIEQNTTAANPKKNVIDFLHFDEPTTEQIEVLNAIQIFVAEDYSSDFMVVCGSAGTGKSSIMNAVVNYAVQEKFRIQIAAPTGRAARLISAKSDATATTLHSLLYTISTKGDEAPILFTPKKERIEDYTIFIIDEASMVSSKTINNSEDELFICNYTMLNTIAGFIKSGNKNNKVIFVGDRYQLSPIGEEDSNALYPAYLKQTYDWKGQEFHITEVKRTDKDSYILAAATSIRKSIEQNEELPNLKLPSLKNIFSAVPAYIKDLQTIGPNRAVTISRTNNQCKIFNTKVRESLFGNNAPIIMHNDVITIRRNWHRKGINLYNGDTAIVKEVFYNEVETVADLKFLPVKLRVKNNKNEEVEIFDYLLIDTITQGSASLGILKENVLYNQRHTKNKTYRESKNIEDDRYLGAIRATYGYCITCHTAQGGEWEKAYVNSYKLNDARWAYTAFTRAKNELFLF